MRRLMLFVLLMTGSACLIAAESTDTPEARRAAAERYLKVADFENLMMATIRASAEARSPQSADEVTALIRRHLRMEVFMAAALAGMVNNFTADELNAMADFYGSPAGRSAMAKLPGYTRDVMPLLQAEVAHALEGIRAELAAKAAKPAGT